MLQKRTVGVITLGCDKNRVDTERVLFALTNAGYGLAELADADIILINTCAFIKSAKDEAIDAILEGAEYKKQNASALVVMGCFAQRYADAVKDNFPEVDAFVSMSNYQNIVQIFDCLPSKSGMHKENAISLNSKNNSVLEIETVDGKTISPTPWFSGRVQTTPPHYAYLRIADGCNNRCTYCAIPSIRGVYRSEPMQSIISEAQGLVANGVKELIVVAQDTTRYGEDLGRPMLVELLTELTKLDAATVRLMYAYPEKITDELLSFIQQNPKMAKYIDVPLQHISDRILKLMARRTTKKNILDLMDRIARLAPSVKIRSSFIVGFPSETNEDFLELKEFISEGRIDYAGFFAYSKEEGTPAERLPGQLPERLKQKRRVELEKAEQLVIEAANEQMVGDEITVIYEGIDLQKGKLYARLQQASPDIDGTVYLTADKPLDVGERYIAKVIKGGFFMQAHVLRDAMA